MILHSILDIDAMVAALQFQCGGETKEEGGVEHVDFQDDTFCSSDSGGTKILFIPRTVIILYYIITEHYIVTYVPLHRCTVSR